jgi:hypothetical protein
MAKGDYYFPLYYRRLLTSTIGWKDDEFGAYMRLLIFQFDNGSIPSNLNELARIAPSVRKHWPLLSKKFKDDGNGRLINEVMDEVHQDIQKKKEKNAENGKKGGRRKNPPLSERLPNGSKNETQTEAILITNNQQSINKEKEDPLTFFSIEHCLTIALADERWVRANKVKEKDLQDFNGMLEKRAVYEKNPADYKNHYANWSAAGKKDDTPENNEAGNQLSARELQDKKMLEELHGPKSK